MTEFGFAAMNPAAAANAMAVEVEIKARFALALQRPRDIEQVNATILDDLQQNPDMAEEALYRKPLGKQKNPETGKWEQQFAVDFSCRFVEHAIHRMGNIYVAKRIAYESENETRLLITVMDIEKNLTYSTERTVAKTVERKDPKGRIELSRRQNSQGETVSLLAATPDESQLKVGSEYSKMLRDEAKKLLDRNMLIQVRKLVDRIMADSAAKDPKAAIKKIIGSFAGLGISHEQLSAYVEKPLDSLTSEDVILLRELYTGLREHSFSWEDALVEKRESGAAETSQPVAPSPGRPSLKDKIMAKHAANLAAEAKPEPQPEEEPQK
jgi:hypothetical protein